ncbi:MAG: DUF1573 domain-containing protein [Flavobacteriales bacterium]|nr:DUF1573 domain-containing protein [Flavobacteriales bacterium]
MERLKKWAVDLSRNFFFLLFLAFATISCESESERRKVNSDIIQIPSSDEEAEDMELPKIEFEETEFSTGKITQGEIVNYTYKFENTGDAPLVISSVQGSCGCTIPRSYPTGKIFPGEGGEIEVEFNSDSKYGEITVSISVIANTVPSLTQLIINTNIVVPDKMKTD